MSDRVDVWLGSSLGIMKGVNLDALSCTNYLPGGLTLSQTDKSHEMVCMCREKETLYVGLRRGAVQAFDCQQRQFTMECDVTGGAGTLVGVAKHEGVLITCTDTGSLSFWPPGEEKWGCEVGKNTCCMSTISGSCSDLHVATGGREQPLRLWRSQHCSLTPVFTAKNVRPDSLDLRVPVWVNRVVSVPDCGPQPIVVTGTGYGHVRMYDTRAQRRPVFSIEYGNEPITALCVTPDSRSCVVGNSVGDIGRLDLRAAGRGGGGEGGGGVVGRYKGFGGGLSAVSVSRDGAVMAACGLDRYLRVFSLKKPALLGKVYTKLQCHCLLFSEFYQPPAASRVENKEREREEGEGERDSDGDDVWESMETVGERTGGGGGGGGGGGKRRKDQKSAPNITAAKKRHFKF